MKLFTMILSVIAEFVLECQGHGRFLIPPSRSSMWRYKDTDPFLIPYRDIIQANYNDNQLYCGGRDNQIKNGGKCGVCGDPYQAEVKENEAGGKYALGIITRNFTLGQFFDVTVEITAQHKGYFEFRICPWNNVALPVTQNCLNQHLLKFEDGTTKWYLPEDSASAVGLHVLTLKLPDDVTCYQCVLQWRYRTGNSWGSENGQQGLGLGQQEEFYGCSDIGIRSTVGSKPTFTFSPTSSASKITTTIALNNGTTSKEDTSATGTSIQNRSTPKPATASSITTATEDASSSGSSTPPPGSIVCEYLSVSELKCNANILGVPMCISRDSFYICAWPNQELPFRFACPAGTVCDPAKGRCDHEYNVPRPCGTKI